MIHVINISQVAGKFAENKDVAKELREQFLYKWVDSKSQIILNFKNVDSSTQSFIHAMISDILQKNGEEALEFFEFKNCNKALKSLISTVINYSLE